VRQILLVSAVLLLLAACGGEATPTPDVVATEVAVARAVAATLTAEAPEAMADYVATQVAAAKYAVATLTAEVPTLPSATPPPQPVASATAPPGSQPTAPPPPMPVSEGGKGLAGDLSLVMREVVDDGQAEYGYHVWAPRLLGPDQPPVEGFNRAVDGFVAFAIDDFQMGVNQAAMGPGSSLWITHTVTAATDELLSVLFYVDGYVTGAAHPFHYAHTLNYDLEEARVLTLGDLFEPGAGYLDALSAYSLDDLRRQGVLEWEDGALPTAENYQRWNITPDGLLISFDEYSVAPYAAGPQAVLVPYAVLEEVIAPEGPLAPFVQ
jgi:hypothetical protein